MDQVSAGVSGNGWPRRKRRESVASGAVWGEGEGAIVACKERRSGTFEVVCLMTSIEFGSRMGIFGR
jgi:hypothetical protein